VYARHGEPVGSEANAREEILVSLVKRGWIRIRKYGNRGYSINVARLNGPVRDKITAWAQDLIEGNLGIREDRYIDVRITSPIENGQMSLSDLAKFKLFGESVERQVTPLTYVKSCRDM
jgi:hypothetical protein